MITTEFKHKVVAALIAAREMFTGSDKDFSNMFQFNNAIWSRLKRGETEGLIKDEHWLKIGKNVGVSFKAKQMAFAETAVYRHIKEDIDFCQENSKSMIFIGPCEIGKSATLKRLRWMGVNRFYVNCSEARTKQLFIRALAVAIGESNLGTYTEVKVRVREKLEAMPGFLAELDDAGYLNDDVFLDINELWNATEGYGSFYVAGDEALRHKIEKGIKLKKPGMLAFVSRFSTKYSEVTPTNSNLLVQFYNRLLKDVISVNIRDRSQTDEMVKFALEVEPGSKKIGGLRRAESILILNGQF